MQRQVLSADGDPWQGRPLCEQGGGALSVFIQVTYRVQ